MSIRDKLEKSPTLGIGIVVVVLGVSLVVIMFSGGSPKRELHRATYFYDLDTKTLYGVANSDGAIPPVVAPSGGEGVQAKVYACGNCDDESKVTIGLLEKYNDEAKKFLEKAKPGEEGPELDKAIAGLMVKTPDGKDWISVNDDAASAIITGSRRIKCSDGVNLVKCLPKLEKES